MKKIINILIIGVFISCQSLNNETEKVFSVSDKESIGRYVIHGFNRIRSIDLNKNGEFIYENKFRECTSGGHTQRIRGYFDLKEDKLTLKPKYLIRIQYFGSNDKDFEKDSIKYHSSNSTYIKKEYQIVKWDKFRYLLSEEYYPKWKNEEVENDFERFADHNNSGYEPKTSGNYFAKRNGDYLPQTKFDKSAIPLSYRNRFLEEPISTQIIEVIESKKNEKMTTKTRKLYKLNKGVEDGVLEKMIFYGNDECCTIRITKVENKVSYGYIYLCDDNQAECGKGERVTTYLEREKGKFKNVH